MAQNWLNKDSLFLQFGTDKTTNENAGEFMQPGSNRVIEVTVDLTKLTSTALIQSNTLIFPAGTNIFIEKVEAVVETTATGGTSLSVGLIQMDRATIPTNYSTAFINAETALADAGDSITYNEDTTNAGGLIGSTASSTTGPYYITALSNGTWTAGSVKVRIFYHGIGTISQ
jgi:hypothetical protein